MARGAKALEAMIGDKDCVRFLTVSGAMTVGKMDLVICDMIELGLIHAISSTGALMAHGLVSSIGLKHYKYNPKYDDTDLARLKLNRVTDTLEPETNLDTVEEVIGTVIDKLDGKQMLSPTAFNKLIGKHLAENYPNDRGVLKSAYLHGVPVFVPAFVDSELGNDIYIHNIKRRRRGKKPILMDLELDSKELIRVVTGLEALWHFFHRRRRAAQQRAKRRAVDRDHQRTAGADLSQSPIPLWRENLPGQAALRPSLRLHLFRE